MTNEELQKMKDALEIGRDAARELAWKFHDEYRGYREAEHKKVDADVALLEEAMAIAERATQPVQEVKSWQKRMDEDSVTVRTKEKMFDYALAEIAEWRKGSDATTFDSDAAKRLRLICKMVGIESNVPGDDETLWGAAFAVLGQIRAALEVKPAQDQVAAVRAVQKNPHAATFPVEIWLNVGNGDAHEVGPYKYLSELSWCWESIDKYDVRYVRADLAAAAPSPQPQPSGSIDTPEFRDLLGIRNKWLKA